MIINRLFVKNVGAVREIAVLANPFYNEIAGNNGEGKTSLLESIIKALGGARRIGPQDLREGESKGRIEVDIGPPGENLMLVVRGLREGKSPTLKIQHKDGERRGQRDLDGMLGVLTFDPLAFTRLPLRDQLVKLQELVGPEHAAALANVEGRIKAAETDRTLANRELERFGRVEPVEKAEPVDVGEVSKALKEAEEFNREQDQLSDRRVRLEAEFEHATSEVDRLRKELAKWEAERDRLSEESLQAPRPATHIDTSELHAKLAAAGEQNEKAAAYQAYQKKMADRQDLAQAAEGAEELVAKLRTERDQLAASAELPVEGLTFGDSGIRVNGRLFDRLSSSEQLKMSATIGAAAAPELHIMLIKDASLLDDDSRAELIELAEKRRLQFWAERVGLGHPGAVVLEAGERLTEEEIERRRAAKETEVEF
jgi:DNA repair exonuclease SbcCD ATPase subunit